MNARFRLLVITVGIAGFVIASPRILIGADKRPEQSPTKIINDQLAKVWADNKIKPSQKCTDYEFVRRVFLDLIGRIPKPDEVKKFKEAPEQTRRSSLIQTLLYDSKYNDEYARHWANVWSVWLLTRTGHPTYHDQMHMWLEDRFKENTSHKDMVNSLLTAKGKTNDNQAVNYILAHLGEATEPARPMIPRRGGMPDDEEAKPTKKQEEEGYYEAVPITSRTTRLFLGLQTQCVQCHDHPFNPEWKQSAFWGVNAFFRQVKQVGTKPSRDNPRLNQPAPILELKDDSRVNTDAVVYFERRNGMILPTTPTFVDGRKIEVTSAKSRRELLADLIVNHENFPKEYVNRMWGHFFGRGLNEQPAVDDFGDHNKVLHPELLDKLADAFANYGDYSPKELFTWICNSDAYQLSSMPNGTNDKPDTDVFFSRMALKSMTPEQLLDSLWIATQGKLASTDGDMEAVKKRKDEWTRKLVKGFGDDEGNEVNFNGTVVQALLMMNGREINDEIKRDGGTVNLAIKSKRHNDIVNAIYMAALNRPPEQYEATNISRVADKSGGKFEPTFYNDVMWALLNSNEFILNH